MIIHRPSLLGTFAVLVMLAAACGSGSGGSVTVTPVSSRVAAAPTSTPGGAPVSTQGIGSAIAAPTADATEQSTLDRFGVLKQLVLADNELPFGFRVRSAQPVQKDDIVTAELGIPKLALFIKNSDLRGAWASLYTREQPSTGLSSIVYAFATPAGAAGFVDASAGITMADYPAAVSVEAVTARTIGEKSNFTRYRISGGRSLEMTWSQGHYAGQVILRYSGDIETPGDPDLVIGLAETQAIKMATAP